MTKALERAALILAICVGILVFILCRYVLDEYMSLIVALAAGVAARLLIPYILTADDRKYGDIEKIANAPVLLRENVGVKEGKKLRMGFMLMTADRLLFFCRDKRTSPLEFTIEKGDVISLQRLGKSIIKITLPNGSECEFAAKLPDDVMAKMLAQGFGAPLV